MLLEGALKPVVEDKRKMSNNTTMGCFIAFKNMAFENIENKYPTPTPAVQIQTHNSLTLCGY
jgi:hypothetical protein